MQIVCIKGLEATSALSQKSIDTTYNYIISNYGLSIDLFDYLHYTYLQL